MLANVRIVLVNTTLSANIGAAARALKTMGLSQLYLVEPKVFPSAEATALAAGASDVLDQAKVVATLQDAIADCALVLGTSARSRSIPWPMLDARQAGTYIQQEATHQPVALVFGREDRGLTNEELALCHYHVCIPSNEDYGVLNVAAAVQVLAYEIRMAYLQTQTPEASFEKQMPITYARWDEPLMAQGEMEQFYQHLEKMLVEMGFLNPENPRQIMTRVRRMFGRLRLDRFEYNMWRGVFSRTQELASIAKKQD